MLKKVHTVYVIVLKNEFDFSVTIIIYYKYMGYCLSRHCICCIQLRHLALTEKEIAYFLVFALWLFTQKENSSFVLLENGWSSAEGQRRLRWCNRSRTMAHALQHRKLLFEFYGCGELWCTIYAMLLYHMFHSSFSNPDWSLWLQFTHC